MSSNATSAPRKPFLRDGRPLFFAHRGGSLIAPENTMVAYERGLSYGADALELDIHTTRDGEWVVIHDDTLDRTTDARGPVRERTLAELQGVDAGYRFTPDGGRTYPFRGTGVTIPTLREVYQRFPDTRVNIDLKEADPTGPERLLALLRDEKAEDRTCVGSFHPPVLRSLRALSGGRLATSAGPTETRQFLVAHWLRRLASYHPPYDALQVPVIYRGIRVVTPASIRAAHRLGLDVHVWTVDDPAEMRRLLAWGVDGLMSDRPDLLADVLREWASANVEAHPRSERS